MFAPVDSLLTAPGKSRHSRSQRWMRRSRPVDGANASCSLFFPSRSGIPAARPGRSRLRPPPTSLRARRLCGPNARSRRIIPPVRGVLRGTPSSVRTGDARVARPIAPSRRIVSAVERGGSDTKRRVRLPTGDGMPRGLAGRSQPACACGGVRANQLTRWQFARFRGILEERTVAQPYGSGARLEVECGA